MLGVEGFTGWRGNSCECPLSRFLRHEFPELTFIVHPDSITIRDAALTTFRIELESAYSDFVTKFDQGEYTFLVDHKETPATISG